MKVSVCPIWLGHPVYCGRPITEYGYFIILVFLLFKNKKNLFGARFVICNMTSKFSCEQCDFMSTRKGNLLPHINSIHKGVKFPCDQCDHKASQKRSLMRHIKSIHEGVKFPCYQCDYKATWKDNLLRHIKSIHEGVKLP